MKRERNRQGLTIEELAAKLPVTSSSVAQYESGRVKNPSRLVVEAMDEALRTTPVIALAFGFTQPVDVIEKIVGLQEQVEDLYQQVKTLAEQLSKLQRRPRRRPPGDNP